jgi:hypothetical protein
MQVERVPLDSIHPDPANANVHSEDDILGLMAKLSVFTQVEPLVVQAATRKVIGGNGRLEAMRRLGWAEADVHLIDVDNVTATAMGIALNTRRSHLDPGILSRQLGALRSEGWGDFAAAGFDEAELEGILGPLGGDGAPDGEPADPAPASEPRVLPHEGTLRYELVFGDVDQQGRWFRFVKWMKAQDDLEAETVAGRFDRFLGAYGPAEMA